MNEALILGWNIGLVGHGRWGRVHLTTLLDLKEIGLVSRICVCDTSPERIANLPQSVDATYLSTHDMLGQERLDAAAIVTPANTHLSVAHELLAQSIPCLIEKPMSESCETTLKFLNESTNDSRVMIGYLLRHHPGITTVHNELQHPEWGGPLHFHYTRHITRPAPKNRLAIDELGLHGIDLAGFLFEQDVREADTKTIRMSPEQAIVELTFPNSSVALIDVAWGASSEQKSFMIRSSNQSMEGHLDNYQSIIIQNQSTQRIRKTLISTTPLFNEWKTFLSCLKQSPEQWARNLEHVRCLATWQQEL